MSEGVLLSLIMLLIISLFNYYIGLPAHQLDIHVGDMIIEVEGTDVIRANGELVANMIK